MCILWCPHGQVDFFAGYRALLQSLLDAEAAKGIRLKNAALVTQWRDEAAHYVQERADAVLASGGRWATIADAYKVLLVVPRAWCAACPALARAHALTAMTCFCRALVPWCSDCSRVC